MCWGRPFGCRGLASTCGRVGPAQPLRVPFPACGPGSPARDSAALGAALGRGPDALSPGELFCPGACGASSCRSCPWLGWRRAGRGSRVGLGAASLGRLAGEGLGGGLHGWVSEAWLMGGCSMRAGMGGS